MLRGTDAEGQREPRRRAVAALERGQVLPSRGAPLGHRLICQAQAEQAAGRLHRQEARAGPGRRRARGGRPPAARAVPPLARRAEQEARGAGLSARAAARGAAARRDRETARGRPALPARRGMEIHQSEQGRRDRLENRRRAWRQDPGGRTARLGDAADGIGRPPSGVRRRRARTGSLQ